MPLYEYECTACRFVFEKLMRHSDPESEKENQPCPCGKPAHRIISSTHFELKGDWFKTKGKY